MCEDKDSVIWVISHLETESDSTEQVSDNKVSKFPIYNTKANYDQLIKS